MENPPFWWYLPRKMRIFQCYVSLREGNYYTHQVFLFIKDLRCSWAVCGVEDDLVGCWGLHLPIPTDPTPKEFSLGGGEKKRKHTQILNVWSIYLHLASSLWWNVGKTYTIHIQAFGNKKKHHPQHSSEFKRGCFEGFVQPWRSSPVLLDGGQIYQKFIPLKRGWIKSDLQLFKVVDMSWWF